jgi:hypothetical protein
MKKSRLLEIIKEVMSEEGNVTGAISPLQTPAAFAKKGQGKNAATKQGEKFGFTTVKEKKRPYSTKGITYLKEEDAGNAEAPYAFTTEEGLHTHAGVKISEKLGMQIANKTKKSTNNKVKNSQKTDNKSKK